MRRMTGFAIAVGLIAATSQASDIPVAGTRVQIRAHGTRAKLAFTSKDAGWIRSANSNGGAPGEIDIDVRSPAHPTPVSLHVYQVVGKPGWAPSIDGVTAPHGVFRFKNPSAPDDFSAIESIAWSVRGTFKLVVRDALLDPSAPQGGLSIRVTNDATRLCARFDAATIVKDVPGSFRARNSLASALADCSAPALGGVTCDLESGGSCGGTCEGDAQCSLSFATGSATCVCAGGSSSPCGDSSPVCNGFCPAGMHCGGQDPNDLFGRACGCVPDGATACGEADYPTCGGACTNPTAVCRPTRRAVSINPEVVGCECSPIGGCTDGDGTPGEIQGCGSGADCPPGTICNTIVYSAGCFARCTSP
jgi:hypothetical protein